ncbi:MAG: indolepyruvate ferredoxin oxidoreductase subunit alpha [Evtepia sp.]|uniref:indolepyruvate ferredoxin oxidoreductase subunit alpha n=1 Tax=Evtepia sp. TaxID=2773933 RepID=UPI002A75A7D2|nr:indolepyruvate ferredoxin oxidoreductase subunit alpha [Evtepia sp.]MDY3014995.1 indolepyruvate ferredoxin oxidoreductase subunit alpha [Evtepia sp.]
MKKLMLGNEAVARGLYEAGCGVISSYPGTPSTEITEQAANYEEIYCEWAPNEKVAMEVAFGAALAGKRSACVMKHVGVNVAADPLFTIAYTGINAGMVICVADDPGMHSSQNEQDSRHYAVSAKLPMLEPADSQEARDFAIRAFQLSEEFDTPVFLKLCTRISHSQSIVTMGEREEVADRPYEKDIAKYVMVPGNARHRHPVVEERTKKLEAYAETTDLNREEMGEDTSFGIITSSTCYQYAREVFGPKASILKLGLVNPLPRQKILDFAKKVDRLIVLEELDPVIEEFCRGLGLEVTGKDKMPMIGEFAQGVVAQRLKDTTRPWVELGEGVPPRPPVLCAGCPHRGLFYTLAKHKVTVLGDIGCYTLAAYEPLYAIETCECMGASVSSIHGFNKALGKQSEGKTVAVLGDSTFMHSGMTGLANIAYNQSNSTVIILDNSTTGMTGHQQNPTTGKNLRGDPAGKIDLETLCRAMGINRVRVVDPYDLKATEKVVVEELAAEEPSVIITRRPCVLLKSVKKHPPYRVDPDKCKSCTQCMKLGCPAISWKEKKAVVDPTQCVGCGVCDQLCKFDAFLHEEG